MSSTVRTRRQLVAAFALAALSFADSATPAHAVAQELRYTVAPQAFRLQWDNDLGLEDTYLYGGRLGFVFGQYVGLSGYYLTRTGVATQLGGLALVDSMGNPLGEQEVALRNYGADVTFNIGANALQPFVKAGGSVLRITPDSGAVSNQIALKFGGGVRLGRPGGVQLKLTAEDWLFRLNRYALAPRAPDAPLLDDSTSGDLRHNLALGAAVTVPFGGSAQFDDRPETGLGNVGLPIELMAGRLDFDDGTGLARQRLIGARTGINFGRYVGLRGFYWRGVTHGFDDTEPIQGWGGEAQFNLGTGPGLLPYAIAGAGKIDFRGAYRDIAGNPRDDETSLILGGGVALAISETFRVNISARDYMFSDRDLNDVASTDQLRHNWLFGAGVSFNAFGGPPERRTVRRTDTVRVTQRDTIRRRDTVFVDARTGDRIAGQRADSLRRAGGEVDTRAMRAMRDTMRMRPRGDSAAARRYVDDRTITIPVPTEGELYIRYGPDREPDRGEGEHRGDEHAMHHPQEGQHPGAPPTGMRAPAPGTMMMGQREDLRQTIREVVRDELDRARMADQLDQLDRGADTTVLRAGAARPGGITSQRLLDRIDEQLEMRNAAQRDSVRAIVNEALAQRQQPGMTDEALADRIARLVDDRVNAELDRRAALQRNQNPSVVVVGGDSTRAVSETRQVLGRFEPRSWSGYSGFTFTDGAQFLLGARGNLGPISRGLPSVDLVPEIAFGFGNGAVSTLLAANARYSFPGFDVKRLGLVRPYVSLGLGFLNFSNDVSGHDGLDIVMNPAYGLSARLPGLSDLANAGAQELFIEHQGIGFFDVNRILVGLQWSY